MLLDTNALFLPVRSGFPLEAEIARLRPEGRVRVPTSVRGELDRLVARNAPGAAAARALAQRFPALPAVGRGDAAVLRAAVQQKASVVTADRALRERLRQQGVPVLYPRDRHRLELFDPAPAPRGPPAPRRPRHG